MSMSWKNRDYNKVLFKGYIYTYIKFTYSIRDILLGIY